MALTDPVNVQAGEQRRKILLARLAQQMAAKSAAGKGGPFGSLQSVGRSFGNSVDLQTAGAARFSLPFDLPAGRMRPAGFDPTPVGVDAPVPMAPPLGGSGGSAPASAAPASAPAPDLSGLPQQGTSVPGGLPIDPTGFNSDTPLQTPAPAASMAPTYADKSLGARDAAYAATHASPAPDPYQMMMARINQLRQARMNAMGIGV